MREDLSELRAEVESRDGRCVWPTCSQDRFMNPLELAHLHHRGMGGSRVVNIAENCVMMCRFHHSVFDGRIVGATARAEWGRLFAHLAGL